MKQVYYTHCFCCFLFIIGCGRLPQPQATTPQSENTCKTLAQDACAKDNSCIFNTAESACESKISGQSCSDYADSSFQCNLVEPFTDTSFGCLYTKKTCKDITKCSDIKEQKKCDSIKKQKCIFTNNQCQEKNNINKNNFDVKKYLAHTNPEVQKWFYETFTAFGSYLLYYQTLAINHNKQGIEQQLNTVFGLGLPGDGANRWLGVDKDNEGIGDLDDINNRLTAPAVRTIWEAWVKHPANLLSWIIYPVNWTERADFNDLLTNFLAGRVHGNMLMWTDDGLCMFSWIMNLTVPICPPQQKPRPDPQKWLKKIENDVATTNP